MDDVERQLLRHTLATVAYRGRKAVADAPTRFATFRPGAESRTASEILAHLGDLFEWALSLARGQQTWHDSVPRAWPEEIARFFQTLKALDDYLASAEPLAASPERLFQGPIADALTHIGQIAMLRRLAGAPIRAENYSVADIVAGRVGPEQTAPKREF
jgi:hypothetical protein